MQRSKEEIRDMVQKAYDSEDSDHPLFGMSYEEGVRAALDWVTGDIEEPPIE